MKARIAMLGVSVAFAASLFMTVPRGGAPAPEGSETLTGEAEGFAGPVKVEVVRFEDAIFSVAVIEQNETPEIGGAAIEPITTAMVEANSPDVDTVSGATVTSEAIIAAVKSALGGNLADAGEEVDPNAPPGAPVEVEVDGGQGKIKLVVYRDGDAITAIEVKEHKESGGIGAQAFEPLIAAMLEKQSADVDNISGATLTSEAVKKAVTQAMSGPAPASPPTGVPVEVVVKGFVDDIVMDVYREGDTLTGIVIKDHKESGGIGEAAFEPLIAAIMEKKSTDVDNISGATVTSEAVKKGVEEGMSGPAPLASAPEGLFEGTPTEVTTQGYGGDIIMDVYRDGDTITGIFIKSHNETKGIGDAAFEPLSKRIVFANSVDVDNYSGATVTSEAIKKGVQEALNQEAPATQTQNTQFEGTATEVIAEGFGGDIVMDVYRDGDTITGIVVKSHNETKGIGDVAFEPLFERIITKNAVDVDNYSGATVTSEAVKGAIGTLLAQ